MAVKKQTLSISDVYEVINDALHEVLNKKFWVKGEVSEYEKDFVNVKKRKYGQVYFELIEKDENMESVKAKLKCIVWGDDLRRINSKLKLQDGIEVLLYGCIKVYEKKSEIEFFVEDIDPEYTFGSIYMARKRTVELLKKQGVFEKQKGLKLPVLPLKVGVITSKNSAAYHDFISELGSQGYPFKILLYDSVMEGAGCVESVMDGLSYMYDVDVVCIVRGGGAKVDFLPFDDFKLAFKIATFPKPVITGLGHEIDISVSDMVANKSFKTPTKVAQFLCECVANFERELDMLKEGLILETKTILEERINGLNNIIKSFINVSRFQIRNMNLKLKNFVYTLIRSAKNILVFRNARVDGYLKDIISILKQRLYKAASQLDRLNLIIRNFYNAIKNCFKNLHKYLDTMEKAIAKNPVVKGFAVICKNGRVVRSALNIKNGDLLEINLKDGRIDSSVINVRRI